MLLVEDVPAISGKLTGSVSVMLDWTFTSIGELIPAPPNKGPPSFRVTFCNAWLKESQFLKFVLLAGFPLLMVKAPLLLFICANNPAVVQVAVSSSVRMNLQVFFL
jgi:hypothetical protein